MKFGNYILVSTIFFSFGVLFTLLFINIKSRFFRKNNKIPNILGKWKCKWFDDELKNKNIKIEDTIEILNWVKNGEFIAIGTQPEFHLTYPITGEIDPSRVVTMEYRANKYPFEPNRGIVSLLLSRDGKEMKGKWYGRRSNGQLGGGNVICERIV